MPMRWFDSDVENYERGGCAVVLIIAAGVIASASVLLQVL